MTSGLRMSRDIPNQTGRLGYHLLINAQAISISGVRELTLSGRTGSLEEYFARPCRPSFLAPPHLCRTCQSRRHAEGERTPRLLCLGPMAQPAPVLAGSISRFCRRSAITSRGPATSRILVDDARVARHESGPTGPIDVVSAEHGMVSSTTIGNGVFSIAARQHVSCFCNSGQVRRALRRTLTMLRAEAWPLTGSERIVSRFSKCRPRVQHLSFIRRSCPQLRDARPENQTQNAIQAAVLRIRKDDAAETAFDLVPNSQDAGQPDQISGNLDQEQAAIGAVLPGRPQPRCRSARPKRTRRRASL